MVLKWPCACHTHCWGRALAEQPGDSLLSLTWALMDSQSHTPGWLKKSTPQAALKMMLAHKGLVPGHGHKEVPKAGLSY